MKSIIVFGATGNLGKYFLDYLMNNLNLAEYKIVAVGRKKEFFCSFYNGKYVSVDITVKEDFEKLPKNEVYAVVDFAGLLPAYDSVNDVNNYVNVNVNGTLNILEYCKACGADRIIYTQTWADLNGYLIEKKPLKPYMPRKPILTGDHAVYTVTKSAAVDLTDCYREMYGIKNFIFRLPNIYLYSPDEYYYVNGEKRLISYRYMIKRAMESKNIELWGNENCGKDIIYVKDLCQMIFKSLFVDLKCGVYNAGTGIKTTMREQIEGIIEVFSPKSNKSKIIACPEKRDCDDFVMDISNAVEELGYIPKYNYLDYLKDYKMEMELNRF